MSLPTMRLVGDVGAVLEMHGHSPVRTLAEVARLREALFGFLNPENVALEARTAAGAEKGAAS
jgi:hypothetical protein